MNRVRSCLTSHKPEVPAEDHHLPSLARQACGRHRDGRSPHKPDAPAKDHGSPFAGASGLWGLLPCRRNMTSPAARDKETVNALSPVEHRPVVPVVALRVLAPVANNPHYLYNGVGGGPTAGPAPIPRSRGTTMTSTRRRIAYSYVRFS